ncbi:MAG TPA: hypothetical protein VLM42_07720, partial [Bryobacteraceae bacterium]|nr:hypothetical protein [Bryobacteraceae bacterium]
MTAASNSAGVAACPTRSAEAAITSAAANRELPETEISISENCAMAKFAVNKETRKQINIRNPRMIKGGYHNFYPTKPARSDSLRSLP